MTITPAIDYTNKDYAALRQAMLDLARYRLPEWTDQSPADLGMLLVDLFAYMGDIILYYQDRIASELFLSTATERRSVLNLLRLVGYELAPPVAAQADLALLFRVPGVAQPVTVVVPNNAQFTTKSEGGAPQQTFEYLGPDLTIDLTSTMVVQQGDRLVYSGLPVNQSRTLPLEILGSSTGEPNQRFRIAQTPLIRESLVVEVNEGAEWVRWERRENLIAYTAADGRIIVSAPDARDYYVQFDEHDVAYVVFGDGAYGRRPPVGTNNIRARYRVGGGAAGNVPAGAISQVKTTIPQLDTVSNPAPAAGGADRESVEHAVRFGPLAFRSGQRAVTLDDFVALAHQAGGVARATASSRDWNQIDLYVAPEGDSCRPVPEGLRRRLLAYLEERRMVGTTVQIRDALCVPVEISVDVVIDRRFQRNAVLQAVEDAVRGLLAFRNVDFAQSIYLSDIYGAVEALTGVTAATITRFRRQDSPAHSYEEELNKLPGGIDALPEFLRQAIRLDVAAGGRIEIDMFEIPTLGDLVVREVTL